jgi:transposase
MQSAETVTLPKAEYERLMGLEAKQMQLEQQLAQLQRLIFGRKSERFVPDTAISGQPTLFSGLEAPVVEPEVEKEQITYERKKGKGVEKLHPGRNELPASLPRQEVVIEPEEDVTGMVCIGKDVTEELDYRPGKLFVRRYVRPRYARPGGEGVAQAKVPPRPIDKGIAGPNLLAQIIADKYVDHLPLYRQAKRYEREGMRIPDATLGDWLRQSMQLLEIIYAKIKEKVLASAYLMGDETTIKVLQSDKKGSTHLGYYWVYYDPVGKLPLFIYQPGRAADYPKADLKIFSGYLQTDGYQGYEKLSAILPQITHLCCWAHARREFEKALTADKEKAGTILTLIQQLYSLERRCREEELTYEQRLQARQEHAVPVLEKIKTLLEHHQLTLPPKDLLADAAAYSLRRWDKLCLYCQNGLLEIDNNPVENAIRPVALGRKNYLFAGSHDSAQRAAVAYTILAACKASNINPPVYLADVLQTLPSRNVNEVDDLLPAQWAEKNSLELVEG